jgi:hypothetical protein
MHLQTTPAYLHQRMSHEFLISVGFDYVSFVYRDDGVLLEVFDVVTLEEPLLLKRPSPGTE